MGADWFIDLAQRKEMRTTIGEGRNGIFAHHFAEKYRFIFGQTIPAMLTFLAPTSDDAFESAGVKSKG